jgi:hypothetical protein
MKARVGRKSLTDASRVDLVSKETEWVSNEIQQVRFSRHKVSGGNTGVVPPDPIPNSEVKHSRADGTAR